MAKVVFTEQDRLQIEAHGLRVEDVEAQLARFRQGFPPPRLVRPCTVGDGILRLSPEDHSELIALYDRAAREGRALKFTPASGAATRMFRSLMLALQEYPRLFVEKKWEDPADEQAVRDAERLLNNLERFAFCSDLAAVLARAGLELKQLKQKGELEPILRFLLTDQGLDYARLPKALIKFHTYPEGARTPLEEHLVEGLGFLPDAHHRARFHFTVPQAYREAFDRFVESVRSRYENQHFQMEISYSVQSPSTDIIAVDFNNRPVRDLEGRLVFRPGGHGALLQNLNALRADLVFVKNIDNVVPDRLKPEVVLYKELLGGYLVKIQVQVFQLLEALDEGPDRPEVVHRALAFIHDVLKLPLPAGVTHGSLAEKHRFARDQLNRPIRVCGMVPNAGEPGGGPFWVQEKDGSLSRQIVEQAQVDLNDPRQKQIWEQATHFNPTDMVLGVCNYRGEPFDLMQFRDPETGFITVKSFLGKAIKAMEWPGLWNGSMARWISLFVEVPLKTFNPVKTVFDLLRPEHQPA